MNRLLHGVLWRAARRVRESHRIGRASNRFSRANLYEFVDDQVDSMAAEPPGVLLNVGAGGELGARLERLLHWKRIDVDIDLARKPDVVADICQLGCLADASVDAVFALEVLEHVKEPSAALAELRRVLRPGGTVVLSTPFLFETHDVPHDYHRFTRFGLAYLLREFHDVSIARRNGYLASLLVPLLRLHRSPYPTDVLLGGACVVVASILRPLIVRLDRAVRSEEATSGYVVVGRR